MPESLILTDPLQRQSHPAGIVGAHDGSVDLRKQRSELTGSRPIIRALPCLPGGVTPGPSGVTKTALGS
ncbi:hypothetical protein ACFYY8_21315 [Streptosporangium sp. NPDC001559]|uniref:hypothetical protein n=1 Tax=Streptosporangium sp. NPDC001559 TaxID=3366187 RepID=UPI0036F06D97